MNNAGIYRFEPLEEVTEDEFHRQFNTNVLGTILATREAVKHFGPKAAASSTSRSVASGKRCRRPRSIRRPRARWTRSTRVLAAELGPRNIRVNTIAPGGVETEGTHAPGVIGSDFEKQIVAQTPLGRSASRTTSPGRRRVPRLGRCRLDHRRAA